VTFLGGPEGEWRVERIVAIRGEPLPACARVARVEGQHVDRGIAAWSLHGVRTHERYTERAERDRLAAVQPPLGRAACTRAALIPITKSETWWDLAQDERRAVLETRSHHVTTGLQYLPAIARRLYHGREIGSEFDFLTWFEFEPRHEIAFDELTAILRASEEWRYVEREVEVRVSREA
jgi:hypothetical protein